MFTYGCIYKTESLCRFTPETNPMLWVNYTSIKKMCWMNLNSRVRSQDGCHRLRLAARETTESS